ncbi:hypothetical protein HY480_02785 [Candidatus Uhrbacteria bacterium]|nr:hypothetical protein [Candidatus Uhrbacteria bacterium]
MRTIRVVVGSIAIVAVLATSTLVSAVEGAPSSELDRQFAAARGGAGAEEQALALPQIIARIISASLGLIGIVLVVLLVYAGYLWMTAGGEEEKVTKAKDIIRNAIIGLIVVLLAYAISRFVITSLISATSNTGAQSAF